MPKQKTRKSARKRFKKTATGKYMHHRRGGRHILTKKSGKRKRRLRQKAEVKSTDIQRVKSSLPYD